MKEVFIIEAKLGHVYYLVKTCQCTTVRLLAITAQVLRKNSTYINSTTNTYILTFFPTNIFFTLIETKHRQKVKRQECKRDVKLDQSYYYLIRLSEICIYICAIDMLLNSYKCNLMPIKMMTLEFVKRSFRSLN